MRTLRRRTISLLRRWLSPPRKPSPDWTVGQPNLQPGGGFGPWWTPISARFISHILNTVVPWRRSDLSSHAGHVERDERSPPASNNGFSGCAIAYRDRCETISVNSKPLVPLHAWWVE